ncbi:MAG: VCBS repeat-containing protein, partial [Mucilaginibacter polytrichastri]|nr:VCBS repeat-containing protein [Mucilaginibacter polytrichastri]
GLPDLYLASGGYDLYEPGTPALQDRLFLNMGKGRFVLSESSVPNVSASSKGCVVAADYDGDGAVDLFVGGRVIPGQYPESPRSYLLHNTGKGKFEVVKTAFDEAGMITSAQWLDLNNDKKPDLILAGECTPVKVFINGKENFIDQTAQYFASDTHGLWFSTATADLNGDGKTDLIAGNLGRNSQVQVYDKESSTLYYADFDGNGSIDPFFVRYIQGKSYPFVSRDELNEQIYPMRKKFTSYKAYADAGISDIFSAEELAKAKKLTVSENRTLAFLNKDGRYVSVQLPLEAQFSVVSKIIVQDFNGDGKTDVLLLGNKTDNRLKLGSIDANYGCLLMGKGDGTFTYMPQTQSGLSITGDVKSAEVITINKKPYLVVGAANEPLQWYLINAK